MLRSQTRILNHRHIHFIVWAALGKDGENYVDVVYVDVIADSIESAITRAKELCPGRGLYRVNNIIEHHNHEENYHGNPDS